MSGEPIITVDAHELEQVRAAIVEANEAVVRCNTILKMRDERIKSLELAEDEAYENGQEIGYNAGYRDGYEQGRYDAELGWDKS